MFCSKCGFRLSGGNNVCPSCGNVVNIQTQSQVVSQSQVMNNYQQTISNSLDNRNKQLNVKVKNNNQNLGLLIGLGLSILIIILLLIIFVILPIFKNDNYYSNSEIVCKQTMSDKVENGKEIITASFENNKFKLATKHLFITYSSNDLAKSFYDLVTNEMNTYEDDLGCTLNENEVVCISNYNVETSDESEIKNVLQLDSNEINKEKFIEIYKEKGYKCGRK